MTVAETSTVTPYRCQKDKCTKDKQQCNERLLHCRNNRRWVRHFSQSCTMAITFGVNLHLLHLQYSYTCFPMITVATFCKCHCQKPTVVTWTFPVCVLLFLWKVAPKNVGPFTYTHIRAVFAAECNVAIHFSCEVRDLTLQGKVDWTF